MRNPDRIDDFCKDFAKYWKNYYSDLRFGQLCCNFFCWLDAKKELDPFYIEDHHMMKLFIEYCTIHGGNWIK